MLAASLAHALEKRRRESARDFGVPNQRCGVVVGGRRRDWLDTVLTSEIVELVRRASRLDEVREDHRVLGRLHRQPRQCLEVVRDQRTVRDASRKRGLPLSEHDTVLLRKRETTVIDRECRARPHFRELALLPGHLRPLDAHRHRRDSLVQVVDAAEEVAELESPEHLAQLRTVGWLQYELRGIAVELEIAPHRRELLGLACLVGVLGQVLAPSRRQLADVIEDALERAVLRHQLTRRLVPDPGNSGDVVRRVALQADEVRHLVRSDSVARLDAFGCVHVHVGDAAGRHHQAHVVGYELKRVAVRRHDARFDSGFVGTSR